MIPFLFFLVGAQAAFKTFTKVFTSNTDSLLSQEERVELRVSTPESSNFTFGVDACLNTSSTFVGVGFVFGYRETFSQIDISATPVFTTDVHTHGEIYSAFNDTSLSIDFSHCGLALGDFDTTDLVCSQYNASYISISYSSTNDETVCWNINATRQIESFINMDSAYGTRFSRRIEEIGTSFRDDRFMMPFVMTIEQKRVNSTAWINDVQSIQLNEDDTRLWFGDWLDVNTGIAVFPVNGMFTLPPTTTSTLPGDGDIVTIPPRPTGSETLGPAYDRREQDVINVPVIFEKSEFFDPLMEAATYVMLSALGIAVIALVLIPLQLTSTIRKAIRSLSLSDV